MKYIVAVSGGVDSVVLLDMLTTPLQGWTLLQGPTLQREGNEVEIIVAHFDHGIRPNSADDARFVEALAQKYGCQFETQREELGPDASEERARTRRYVFLRMLAKKHNGRIVTAHHLDDIVETIAINLHRGTGWRGLGVLGAADIDRPLLATPKHELYAYALAHNLEWVEDETNHSDVYLRNRLRQKMHALSPSNKARLADLRSTQLKLEKEITAEVKKLAHTWGCRRYPYIMIQQPEALELLRFLANAKLTRPQMHAAWLAIKTAKPHTKHQCGSGVNLQVSFDKFELTVV